MSLDILLCCLLGTFVTFAGVILFATSTPKAHRKDFSAHNWGNYQEKTNTTWLDR